MFSLHISLALRLTSSSIESGQSSSSSSSSSHSPMPFSSPPLDSVAESTYPEVQIQVSTSSKFPVADLEGDGHPVVGVQHLMETFARVGSQLHVVRKAEHHA
jgi:hypothetical protein